MKGFVTLLYSYEYEPQTETLPSDGEEELPDDQDKNDDIQVDSEVVKPKKKRNFR